ncbi:MAG: dockerin type I repeat-containing protein [candidate division Zixibacteria bacterium]|nr:dockerin type I repeat-containing protein [candidate division Zixibacteria bacterium]
MHNTSPRLNILALLTTLVLCADVSESGVVAKDSFLVNDSLHALPVPRGIEGDYRGFLFVTKNFIGGGLRKTDSMPVVMAIRLGVDGCKQAGTYTHVYDSTADTGVFPEIFCNITQGTWFISDGKVFLAPGPTDPGSVCDPTIVPNSFIVFPGGGETIEIGFGLVKLIIPPDIVEIGDSLILRQVRFDVDRVTVFRLELLSFPTLCCCDPGDANGDGKYNIADMIFIIARIFTGGPEPECQDEADANGDNILNMADVTYGIARLFTGGPAPICGTTGL